MDEYTETFLKGRIDFGFAVQSGCEYLTLTIDNEEAVVELFHRKKRWIKKCSNCIFLKIIQGKSLLLRWFFSCAKSKWPKLI